MSYWLLLGHWALTLIPERLLPPLTISDRDGRLRRSDCCRCQGEISSNMTVSMCIVLEWLLFIESTVGVYLYCLLFVCVSCSMILYESSNIDICRIIDILHFIDLLIYVYLCFCVMYAFCFAFPLYQVWKNCNFVAFGQILIFNLLTFRLAGTINTRLHSWVDCNFSIN